MHQRMRLGLWVGLAGVGCGPAVQLPGGGGSGGDGTGTSIGGVDSLSATQPSSVSAGPTAPSTTATTASTASTTSTTSTTSDDGGLLDTGCLFICPPDFGDELECDQWTEDCPDGEKCMPWASSGGAWNALQCSPIAPDPALPGDSCTVVGSVASGVDDCELHSMCWYVDTDTLTGTCVAMCDGSPAAPSCAGSCTDCAITNDGVLSLCLSLCDPVAQDCPGTQVCVPGGDGLFCVPPAAETPTSVGDSCTNLNACSAGQYCSSEPVPGCIGSGCCNAFCSTAADDCPAGMHCETWDPDLGPCNGGPTVGACVAD